MWSESSRRVLYLWQPALPAQATASMSSSRSLGGRAVSVMPHVLVRVLPSTLRLAIGMVARPGVLLKAAPWAGIALCTPHGQATLPSTNPLPARSPTHLSINQPTHQVALAQALGSHAGLPRAQRVPHPNLPPAPHAPPPPPLNHNHTCAGCARSCWTARGVRLWCGASSVWTTTAGRCTLTRSLSRPGSGCAVKLNEQIVLPFRRPRARVEEAQGVCTLWGPLPPLPLLPGLTAYFCQSACLREPRVCTVCSVCVLGRLPPKATGAHMHDGAMRCGRECSSLPSLFPLPRWSSRPTRQRSVLMACSPSPTPSFRPWWRQVRQLGWELGSRWVPAHAASAAAAVHLQLPQKGM